MSDRYLLTEEEVMELDDIAGQYHLAKLKPYELKKIFPVKKILKEKEAYYKKRLNRILEIERHLTNTIFDTHEPIKKESLRCIRDGMLPMAREWTKIRLDKVKQLIRYYERI